MLFSFVWLVYVVDIVGCWMTMWQRSYQVKCDRQKSRGGAANGGATKQISGGVFGLCFKVGRTQVFKK